MEQSAKDTWKRLLDQARSRLPEPTLRTWLEPAEAVSLDDGKLVVATPDQFAAEWNESKHAAMLSDLSAETLGQRLQVTCRRFPSVSADRSESIAACLDSFHSAANWSGVAITSFPSSRLTASAGSNQVRRVGYGRGLRA